MSTVTGRRGDNSPSSTITPNVVEQSSSPSYANTLSSQIESKFDRRVTSPSNLNKEPLSINNPPFEASKPIGEDMPEVVVQPFGVPINTCSSKASHSPEIEDSSQAPST